MKLTKLDELIIKYNESRRTDSEFSESTWDEYRELKLDLEKVYTAALLLKEAINAGYVINQEQIRILAQMDKKFRIVKEWLDD